MFGLVFDDCLSNTVSLLELCAGDDAADEEDADGLWCLAFGNNVHSHGEFSLFSFLVVVVSVVIRVVLANLSVMMKVFCFLVIFSETLVINLSQNHRYLFIS